MGAGDDFFLLGGTVRAGDGFFLMVGAGDGFFLVGTAVG